MNFNKLAQRALSQASSVPTEITKADAEKITEVLFQKAISDPTEFVNDGYSSRAATWTLTGKLNKPILDRHLKQVVSFATSTLPKGWRLEAHMHCITLYGPRPKPSPDKSSGSDWPEENPRYLRK